MKVLILGLQDLGFHNFKSLLNLEAFNTYVPKKASKWYVIVISSGEYAYKVVHSIICNLNDYSTFKMIIFSDFEDSKIVMKQNE